jgi:hypothetical protein
MFDTSELAALLVAISFAAGLNVSATIATIGLLGRAGVLTLPGELDLLAENWVIAVSSLLFLVEFFADKIPAFDLVWNFLQTFIRIPAGALLAYAATSELSPAWQAVASAAGAAIAGTAHAGKVAAHGSVTPSPEPVSNALVSLAEDAFTVFIVWFAAEHPYLAAAIVAAMLVTIVVLIRIVIRALRRLFQRPPEPATGPAAGTR